MIKRKLRIFNTKDYNSVINLLFEKSVGWDKKQNYLDISFSSMITFKKSKYLLEQVNIPFFPIVKKG